MQAMTRYTWSERERIARAEATLAEAVRYYECGNVFAAYAQIAYARLLLVSLPT